MNKKPGNENKSGTSESSEIGDLRAMVESLTGKFESLTGEFRAVSDKNVTLQKSNDALQAALNERGPTAADFDRETQSWLSSVMKTNGVKSGIPEGHELRQYKFHFANMKEPLPKITTVAVPIGKSDYELSQLLVTRMANVSRGLEARQIVWMPKAGEASQSNAGAEVAAA